MQLNNFINMAVAAISALAVTRYYVLPSWFYKSFNFKPLNCTTCLSFWIGVLLEIISGQYVEAPFVGLAAAGLSCLIIKITER